MRKLLLLVFSSIFFFSGFAQERCGTAIFLNDIHSRTPGPIAADLPSQDEIAAQQHGMRGGRAETILVPVVFTVLHDNGDENISDDQLRDALRVLNEDFNAINEDLDDIISSFQGIIGDAEIEFRLASVDPQGNPTTGIQRIESQETYVGDVNSRINGWPTDRYLNVWVSDVITVVGTSASAFSTNPVYNPQPNADGIIANHRFLGVIGTATSNGHTLSHEVGHYLSLHHTWGTTNFPECDGTTTNPNDPCFGVDNCNEDDGVTDTPNCIGQLGGCPLSRSSCGSLDNIQNFMDYANCDAMFTEGQAARLRAALSSTANDAYERRKDMASDGNAIATGVSTLTSADFHLDRYAICRGESVQFFDDSRYDAEEWDWEISGPTLLTSSDQNPSFTFNEPGYYSVSLTVNQGSTSESITETDAIYVSDVYGRATPLVEKFPVEGNGWVTINTGIENDKYEWGFVNDVGYDDNSCYSVYNIGNSEHKNLDELILHGVDFRGMDQVNVSFKVAYGRLNSDDNDKLTLSVSNDCGLTWKTVWTGVSSILNGGKPLTSSIFEPSSQDDWETFDISNIPTAWLGSNTQLKFSFQPGGGNQLYLDNISIDGEYSIIPNLVYPIDGAAQMNDDVLLDWRAVPGATEYEYEVSKDAAFTSKVFSGTLDVIDDEDSGNSDTQFKTSGLEHGTTHYWHVRARVGGTNSEWSETWSFEVADDGVGVDEGIAQEFSVFPNPAQDQVNILLSQYADQASIRMYSVAGVLVKYIPMVTNAANNPYVLDVSELTNGVYLLSIDAANKQWIQRFTIQR